MPLTANSVVFITGASSGIGRACAEHLHAQGYRVYGTSRRPAEVAGLPFPLLAMDVTDGDQVCAAVGEVVEREGRLDAVVNNAGYGIAGAVEETSVEEAQAQLDANFLGVLRVCRAVLPPMREQGSGTIINVSSLAGLVGVPFQGLYSASKFAVEGLTEALRLEVAPFGIRVVLLEPGDFRTGFTARRQWTRESVEDSPYATPARRAIAVMEADEQAGASPELAARTVQRIIEARSPRLRTVVGPLSQRAMAALHRFVPRSLLEWALRTYYQLERED